MGGVGLIAWGTIAVLLADFTFPCLPAEVPPHLPDPDHHTGPLFTAEELENSFPMDVGRRFRGAAGRQLVDEVLDGMRDGEIRQRRRAAKVAERERASVEALLVNLTAACLNVVDPDRFAAVSFNKNDYAGTSLDGGALRRCRDFLAEQGLVIVAPGFRRLDAHGMSWFGRRTRVRASELLRQRVEELGIGRKAFTVPVSELIRTRGFADIAPPCPPDVEESKHLLVNLNHRLAATEIELSADVIAILATRSEMEDEGEEDADRRRKRRYAGDLTANSLYRSFKGDWLSGGRIYGGWWMSLPRDLRPFITINGAQVVELDYGSLHPRLLFHRAGLAMDFDPYLVPPYASSKRRELGKRTFNRLLNREKPDPRKRLRLRAARGDLAILMGQPFSEYLSTFRQHLSPIQKWFGTGEGIRLQREDSDLAIYILSTLEIMGIPVLPIHDSFLVAIEHEQILYTTMVAGFLKLFNFPPEIVRKQRAASFGPPWDHN